MALSEEERKELAAARKEVLRLYREEGAPPGAVDCLVARIAELREKEPGVAKNEEKMGGS